MKATDLMIGDWVYSKKAPELPFIITEINRNIFIADGKFINGKCVNGSSVGPFVEEEIKPIPLTPEILEKNGFTKENRLYYWTQEKDGKTIAGVYYWVDEKHINIAGYEDDGVTISCPYVHILQHALKLCGIDKEIIL